MDGNNKRRLKNSPSPHGYVVNITDDKLKIPRSLSKNYCSHFADVDVTCTFKDKCNFANALFPSEYTDSNISIMMEYIANTRSLE